VTTTPDWTAIRYLVDALRAALRSGSAGRKKKRTEEQLADAIRELLQVRPNLNKVDAAIAAASAEGLISDRLVLVRELRERFPRTSRKAIKRKAKRALRAVGSSRRPARKARPKKTVKKKA